MKKTEVRQCMVMFIAAYPHLRDTPDEVLDGIEGIWFPMLQDVDFETGKLAVQSVLAESDIPAFPAIGRMREAAARIQMGVVPTALEAWDATVQYLRASGRAIRNSQAGQVEEQFRSAHPAAAAVVDRMGADTIRGGALYVGAENPDAMRREFMREYEREIQERIRALRVPAQIRRVTGRQPVGRLAPAGHREEHRTE
jgi:hypothetical protein